MNNNPQKALYKMLAESKLRSKHINSIQQRRSQILSDRTIPALQNDLQRSRDLIVQVGVVGDRVLEDQYLSNLEDLNSFEAHSPTFLEVGVSRFRIQSSLP